MYKQIVKTSVWRMTVTILISISVGAFAQKVDKDKELGAENAKIVEEQMGIYADKEMTKYVKSIGDRLVEELEDNPYDFQFKIVDEAIPNAFALPGGYIYVTRGLLMLVISEDELAGVLSHEIIHVTQRHSIKQMRSSVLPRMLELPGAIVGGVVNENLGDLINVPITTSNTLLLSSYSRSHETESDTKGIELMSKAGYDPAALANILSRLSDAFELLTNEKEKKDYFSSHPYTPKRVKNIEKKTLKLEWAEKDKIANDFPSPFDGLLLGNNPKMGVFDGQNFIHPELNFSITFPENWETSNQPSSVIAIHEDRQAAIVLGLEDASLSPEEHGKLFVNEVKKKKKEKPSTAEKRTVNNNAGYLVTYLDSSGDEIMYIHILWLKMGDNVFKIIGFGPKSFQAELKKSALSLRPLTTAERSSIMVRKLRIVEPKKNESLAELSKRTANVASTEITELINGIDENSKLDSIQRVKIIVKEGYNTN